MQCWMSAFLLVLCNGIVLYGYGKPDGANILCQIKEERNQSEIPQVPDFLRDRWKTTLCRGKTTDYTGRLECSGSFILPKCICSFHQVSNPIYHNYTACEYNSRKDSVNHLSCDECKHYSENKNGPCLNGGNLICEPSTLASEATCNCPAPYSGRFCETKTIVIYRICSLKPEKSLTKRLSDCSEHKLGSCTVGSTIFECTSNVTKEREYQECDSDLNNTTTTMKSNKRVINCGNILQSTSLSIISYANILFILISPLFYCESW